MTLAIFNAFGNSPCNFCLYRMEEIFLLEITFQKRFFRFQLQNKVKTFFKIEFFRAMSFFVVLLLCAIGFAYFLNFLGAPITLLLR